MTIAIALPGYNDLGRSVTPIFLLIDHFLYQFSTFIEKMKKIYRLQVYPTDPRVQNMTKIVCLR